MIGRLHNCPEPILKVTKKTDGSRTELFDFDELEIARQLAITDFEHYEKLIVRKIRKY